QAADHLEHAVQALEDDADLEGLIEKVSRLKPGHAVCSAPELGDARRPPDRHSGPNLVTGIHDSHTPSQPPEAGASPSIGRATRMGGPTPAPQDDERAAPSWPFTVLKVQA